MTNRSRQELSQQQTEGSRHLEGPLIRIFVVDDHEIVRRGLKSVLNQESDFAVVGEAGNAAGLFEQLTHACCDIVLLDISLPDRSGLDILGDLRTRYPAMKVIMFSAHPEEHYALRSLQAGASGYVNKQASRAELVGAIRKVNNGGHWASEPLLDVLVRHMKNLPGTMLHEHLSNREYEIFCQLAAGKAVSLIASDLSLSVNTIATYKSRIFRKLNVKSNTELTRYALDHQLIE